MTFKNSLNKGKMSLIPHTQLVSFYFNIDSNYQKALYETYQNLELKLQ